MRIKVEIDGKSGFCYGVIRAVKTAEDNLESRSKKSPLYSLGDIVHNGSELNRLKEKGLRIIDMEGMKNMHGTTVLIRAHGEPPQTYSLAKRNGIKVIDCTCPVVLRLQKEIAKTEGQVVIFGKLGHAEVNGLVGSSGGRAVVIENMNSEGLGKIDFRKDINIFSQTTKDPGEYRQICEALEKKMENGARLKVNDTICRQVASRHAQLSMFAAQHDVIVFVSGQESSNGKVLYELCRKNNPRSYKIESLQQIKKEWFRNGDSIGICGATSTPKWQLTSCARFLKILLNNYICGVLFKTIYGNYRRF